MIAILIGFAGGTGMPVQTSINTRLTKRTGTPYTTAMINFLVGTGVLFLIALIMEHALVIPLRKIFAAPPWILFGGALAVIFVTSNILLMPRLGSVQTVILPAFGQILMGLCIEQFGWFNSQHTSITTFRLIGVILVLIGVVLIIFAKQSSNAHKDATQRSTGFTIWLWRLLGVITGMCSASQTAINSHLGLVVGSSVTAALINFCVGSIILILINLLLLSKKKAGVDKSNRPAWMWCGGLLGNLYVLGNIFVGQTFGTSIAVVTSLLGMMTGGLLVDQFGLFQSPKNPANLKKILGLIIMVIGTVTIYLL